MSSDLIASLDNGLEEGGAEDVILRRPVGTGANQRFASVKVRAKVTAATEQQISAGISQTELNFIISPTQINAKQWPGGVPVQVGDFAQDARIPLASKDEIICRGRKRSITFVDPVFDGNELVRINGRMSG